VGLPDVGGELLSAFRSGDSVTVKAAERQEESTGYSRSPPRSSPKLSASMAEVFRNTKEIACSTLAVLLIAGSMSVALAVETARGDEPGTLSCMHCPPIVRCRLQLSRPASLQLSVASSRSSQPHNQSKLQCTRE
jgi:hypothetical protein